MILTKSIDILIDIVYNQKFSNQCVSDILKSRGIELDYDNSFIVCETVEELGIFRITDTSSLDGADLIVNVNQKGFDFVDKFETYSNYLSIQQIEQEEKQNKAKEKEQRELEAHIANIQASQATVDAADSAKTSKKWSIIGIVVSSFLAFISLLFNAYQLRDSAIKDDSIKEINKTLKRQDSLLLVQQTLQPKIDSFLNQKRMKK